MAKFALFDTAMPKSSKSAPIATKTVAYDVAEQLRTSEEMAAYVERQDPTGIPSLSANYCAPTPQFEQNFASG